jgi:hypothetical protein
MMQRELADGTIQDFTPKEMAEYETAQINSATEKVKFDADKWKRDRASAYLPDSEQLDMLYWDMKNGTTTFIDHRDSVKAVHPKAVA